MTATIAPAPKHIFRRLPQRPDRLGLLRWLRRCHAWIGLSGAAFGLLFGCTGFLMNHRSVMKIEAGQLQESKVPVELAEPLPDSPEHLAQLLAARFNVPMARVRWRIQAGRPGRMGGAAVKAAEQWQVTFQGHRHFAAATYIPGNRSVELEQRAADLVQLLKRLHKADGGQTAWILLTDAFAGALVLLVLSGTLLWTRLAGPRLLGAGLGLGGLLAGMIVVALGW